MMYSFLNIDEMSIGKYLKIFKSKLYIIFYYDINKELDEEYNLGVNSV